MSQEGSEERRGLERDGGRAPHDCNDPETGQCHRCLRKARDKAREKARIDAGMCIKCNRPRSVTNKKFCEDHRQHVAEQRRQKHKKRQAEATNSQPPAAPQAEAAQLGTTNLPTIFGQPSARPWDSNTATQGMVDAPQPMSSNSGLANAGPSSDFSSWASSHLTRGELDYHNSYVPPNSQELAPTLAASRRVPNRYPGMLEPIRWQGQDEPQAPDRLQAEDQPQAEAQHVQWQTHQFQAQAAAQPLALPAPPAPYTLFSQAGSSRQPDQPYHQPIQPVQPPVQLSQPSRPRNQQPSSPSHPDSLRDQASSQGGGDDIPWDDWTDFGKGK
ncbi:hypothetical protein F5Y06DRAFT_308868 [Hypoxylon sp. FL0890]|nr:hypothetical protein F5Y06DRAFT_308868 [Hypoxylon sp. FL0890]